MAIICFADCLTIPQIGVTLEDGEHVALCLLEGYVRWQWRDLRIAVGVDHHRLAGLESGVPGGADLIGMPELDPFQSQHLCITGIGKGRNVLGAHELRVTVHHPLFPGYLIQILIVQHHDHQARVAPFPPVFGDGDQTVQAEHLYCSVSDQRNYHPLRVIDLCRQGVGDTGAHGG